MSKIVYRTLDFFEAFASRKTPLSLTDLVNILDVPLSSCHDVVQALEKRGYLYEVRPRGGYYPTARLFDIAKAIVENDPIVQRAEPVLQSICDEFKVSAWLGKAKHTTVTYLVVCTSTDPLSYNVTVGSTSRSLYATSSGKAVLASLPVDEQKKILSDLTLTPMTRSTITSKAELLKDLQAGEKRGWFSNREESVEDALAISTRFEWSGSTYVITVAGSLTRVDRQLAKIVKAATAAAGVLGRSPQQ
ncbi:IclR family transcriptional regulator [Polaromonas sp.]|uniref:IclR family transcriptional regulator n=1 Tax=Polaromonas sp. TaxID=1869339 RepID=UPI003BA96089